jgi:uncharacterized SAM-binding protein YcdF (DUF218 family)
MWLVKQDDPIHADAIVIPMGSFADRTLQAADLFLHGLARKVIIVEENMGAYKTLKTRGVRITSNTRRVRNYLISLKVPADSIIILPGDATSTQMETIIIREYLANDPDIDTICVVSSAPHTRRASMIFISAFRKAGMQVQVISSPSSYTNFDADKWWKSREGIQTVLLEYMKIANFVLFERREL